MKNGVKMDNDLKKYYIVTAIDIMTWIISLVWTFLIRGSENSWPFYLLLAETFVGYTAPKKFRTFLKRSAWYLL